MNRLRSKLILVFLVATLAPLGVTLWVTTRLLEYSLGLAADSQARLDEVARSLERTGREFYQHARASLKSDSQAGRITPRRYDRSNPEVSEFWESGEPERFVLSGADGDRLDYLVRRGQEVWRYSADLEVGMKRLSQQYTDLRASAYCWERRFMPTSRSAE